MLCLAEIGRQISHRRFERGFRYAHHVVIHHDLFRAVIAHRDDAAAVVHQRRAAKASCGQRKCADFHRRQKSVARCCQKFAFESFTRRKGDRMNQKIELAVFFLDRLESRINLRLIRYVARHDKRVFDIGGQFFDIFLEAVRPDM